ncbi:MAG: 3-oxoacyl-ACP synthase [Acidobacteria bacterium]|nr:3-oxoacyl-ACP synthase [Acidobacteriota bacterium]
MNEKNSTNSSKTDWDRLRTMSDEDIDTSDIPELDEAFFAQATLRLPKGKVPVLLTMDEEIAEWFRRQEGDFRINLNNALRDYAESHQ